MTDELLAEADKTPADPTKKSFFETLAGPGGKFHDPDPEVAIEKISKGKIESDSYVRSLEQRLDEMRADFLQMKAENESRANLEELLDQLSAPPAKTSATTLPEVQKPTIDSNQIESMVERAVSRREQARRQDQNWAEVKEKLVERYGENWDAHITKQVAELGMTNEEATALAKRAPKAFIRTLGLDQQQANDTFMAPPRTQSTPFTPTSTPVRNWNWYENLRRDKPSVYYDPKTQIQLHKDAIAQGDKFEK